jgi:hypothetical protein
MLYLTISGNIPGKNGGLKMDEKLKKLCEKITKESQERLKTDKLDCECNLNKVICHYSIGKKYARIDQLHSGKYMVDIATEEIFGIKAYGVIHRGHFYGTLSTIDNYYWGSYSAVKIK